MTLEATSVHLTRSQTHLGIQNGYLGCGGLVDTSKLHLKLDNTIYSPASGLAWLLHTQPENSLYTILPFLTSNSSPLFSSQSRPRKGTYDYSLKTVPFAKLSSVALDYKKLFSGFHNKINQRSIEPLVLMLRLTVRRHTNLSHSHRHF